MVLGKVINCVSPKPEKSVIWRDTWETPYISPWGMLERFKLVNYAVSKDVFKVFGTIEANTHVYERAYQNLIDLKGLSHDKLISVFGTTIFESTKLLVNYFIAPLNEGQFNTQFIRKHVAYCPECLKKAYHSIFHQFTVLDSCPFHDTSLKHQCIQCGKVIPYELNHESRNKPFHCKCGSSLSGAIISTKYDKIWPENFVLQNLCEEIRRWLSMDKRDIDRLTKMIISSEPWVRRNGREVLTVALLSIGISMPASFEKSKYGYITSKTAFLSKPVLPVTAWLKKRSDFLNANNSKAISDRTIQHKTIKLMSFELYVYSCLLQSYKSIIRHFKKTCLRSHIDCIKDYINNNYTTKACIHAVAYVRWRQELECKSDPCKIDKGRSLRYGLNAHPIPSLFSVFDNELLFHIVTSNSFKKVVGGLETIEKTQKLWPCALQLLNRVFCIFLLQRYNDWLEYITSNHLKDDGIQTALCCPRLDIKYPIICVQLEQISLDTIIAEYHWIN